MGALYPSYYAPNRAHWRAWLQQHHQDAQGVWLIYYKKNTGMPRVEYADAVEEALCFGWIDSRPNTLDAARYQQLFTPRKPKSPWSALNKKRVQQLTEQGLMAPAGLAAVQAAQKAGTWEVYDQVEAQLVPDYLQAALAALPVAQRNFEAFSASVQKQLLWWIISAQRAETREQRIKTLLAEAAKGLNPLDYHHKKREAKG